MKRTTTLIALVFAVGCIAAAPVSATGTQEQGTGKATSSPPAGIAELIASGEPVPGVARFAQGFSAVRNGDLTVLTVHRPWQNATQSDELTYVLYPRDQEAPQLAGAHQVVPVPITSIVTMSTTFLAHLQLLGELDALVAVDSVSFAYNDQVHQRFRDGNLEEVGSGPNVDVERLLTLDPDVVMVNSYGGDWDAQPALEEAGLPAVVSGDWVENDPLGRAEWMLFTAFFFNELDHATEHFAEIEAEYRRLVTLAADADEQPRVLINAPYQGTWSVAGGESYAAEFIRDAGGAYVWADDETPGAIFLDIESVYAEAGDADIWINPGTWTSLEQGASEDERFTSFRAFETGRVYNNNRRMGPGGGNDYFESGAVNPHIVLNDLIWAFHPELVPNYEPFYYQRLD